MPIGVSLINPVDYFEIVRRAEGTHAMLERNANQYRLLSASRI
jgi:hypothetical protein